MYYIMYYLFEGQTFVVKQNFEAGYCLAVVSRATLHMLALVNYMKASRPIANLKLLSHS